MAASPGYIPRAWKRGFGYLIVGGWSVSSALLVLWVVLASLKTNRELFGKPWGLPANPAIANYAKVWKASHFDIYFLNSLLVVSLSVLARDRGRSGGLCLVPRPLPRPQGDPEFLCIWHGRAGSPAFHSARRHHDKAPSGGYADGAGYCLCRIVLAFHDLRIARVFLFFAVRA